MTETAGIADAAVETYVHSNPGAHYLSILRSLSSSCSDAAVVVVAVAASHVVGTGGRTQP